MGRKAKPIKDRKTNLYNYYNSDNELEHRLQMMARREGISMSAIRVQALTEYDDRHWEGNYQTLMESYDEGGKKSEGQIEMEIVNELAKKKRDNSGSEILPLLAKIKPEKRKNSFKIVSKQLRSRGVKVWR